jgi:zinc protease
MMLKRSLAFALLLIAALGFAQDVRYEKYTLPNGLTVILHEDHSLPVVVVNTWYKVGSKDEPERRSGFAHLFEHLMFMGTKRVPSSQFDQIMEAGGGWNNASTAEDVTNYYDVGPSNLLPTLLWLEADRMEALGQNIDQKKLDLQRDVVRNERRQNVENTPYGKAGEAISSLMYPVDHPYHNSVIGSHEDLEAATVRDVQAFFSTYYVPNNASMVVAGDFKPAEIKPLIEKLFGTLPRGNDVVRKQVMPFAFKGVKRVTMVDRVQYPKTIMAWHIPPYYQPGDAEMDLAGAVLSKGISSRLYQRLVVKEPLVSEISAYQASKMLGSLFMVEATAREGVSLDRVEAVVDEVLAEFRKSGPTAEELKRQQANLEFGTISGLQSLQNKADRLNEFEFYFGEPNSFRRALDRYRTATPKNVHAVASKVLDPNARLVLRVVPQQEGDQSARDERPATAASGAFNFQQPTELTLANGLKLLYWQRPELPLSSVSIRFDRGADSDPAEKAGRASLAAAMLDEGAGNRSAEEFSDALDLLGAQFSAGAGHESTIVSLSVLTANLDKALDLYADALLRPRFDPKDWQRVQSLTIDALAQENDEPETVARKVALREFFGAAHPYGRPISGSAATAKALSLAEVKDEYSRLFLPSRATVFAAGSLSAEQMKTALDRVLGSWKGSPVAADPLPPPAYPAPANNALRVVLVDTPGAVQTVVRFIMPEPTYESPQRLPIMALSSLLGETFTSRLNANLREDKGYTYGAGTGVTMDAKVGFMVAVAPVRADVTGAAIKEMLAEFAKIRKGDVTDDEVGKARAAMRTSIISSAESLGSLIATAIDLQEKGKPFSQLGADLQRISALTAAEVNAVAGSGVPLERGVLVLVGDKATILRQLEGLGLPRPVEVKAD